MHLTVFGVVMSTTALLVSYELRDGDNNQLTQRSVVRLNSDAMVSELQLVVHTANAKKLSEFDPTDLHVYLSSAADQSATVDYETSLASLIETAHNNKFVIIPRPHVGITGNAGH